MQNYSKLCNVIGYTLIRQRVLIFRQTCPGKATSVQLSTFPRADLCAFDRKVTYFAFEVLFLDLNWRCS